MKKLYQLFALGASIVSLLGAPAQVWAYNFNKPIITEAPDGEVKHYCGSSYAYFRTSSYVESYQDGIVCDLTFTDDGKVYWKNPLSCELTGSYIVGDVVGDKITFELPQAVKIMDLDEYQLLLNVGLMDRFSGLDGWGNLTGVFSSDQNLTFTIGADGTITQDGDAILALCDDGGWQIYYDGFADKGYVLTPFDATPVETPESVVFEEWTLSEDYNTTSSWPVGVGFDADGAIYVKGLSQKFPEWTVKGSLQGSSLVFPDAQFLGREGNRYYMAVNATYIKADDDAAGVFTPAGNDLTLEFDATTHTATSSSPDCAIVLNQGSRYITDYSVNTAIVNPTFTSLNPPISVDYTPVTPGPLRVEDEWESYGQLGFRFEAPCVSVDGTDLDRANCSYEIYVDGELFHFDTVVYTHFPSDMNGVAELPYEFTDNYDITYNPDSDYHYVYFYSNEMTTFGVRMIYTDSEGEKFYSEIAEIENPYVSGLAGVLVDASAPAEYYNLQGVKVANPGRGIYIVRKGGVSTKVVLD